MNLNKALDKDECARMNKKISHLSLFQLLLLYLYDRVSHNYKYFTDRMLQH